MINSSVQMLSATHKKKSKNQIQVKSTDVFKSIVKNLEMNKLCIFNVLKVAQSHIIQRRRVYDFFNLMTALGVCKVASKGKMKWMGIEQSENTISNFYDDIEVASLTKSFEMTFNLGTSPSLGNLALYVISLFLYLNMNTLSLKQISKVFYDGKSDIRSLERRLYLALSFLEVINIIEHSDRVSHFTLKINREKLIEKAWQARKKSLNMNNEMNIEGLLSHTSMPMINEIYERRQKKFIEVFNTNLVNV